MLVRAEPPKINDLYGELALRSAVSPTAAVDAGKTALPDLLFEQVAVVKASDSPVGVDRVIAGTDRSFTYHCLLWLRDDRLRIDYVSAYVGTYSGKFRSRYFYFWTTSKSQSGLTVATAAATSKDDREVWFGVGCHATILLVLGRGERLVQHTHTHHCIRG